MIPQERTIYNLYGGILSVDDVFKEISEKLMRMEVRLSRIFLHLQLFLSNPCFIPNNITITFR
jgi:hypothetical protein